MILVCHLLYLLDEDKKVMLKDAPIEQIDNYVPTTQIISSGRI